MGWNKILIYSCTFFILTSCCTPKYGSNRPKKNKFKLAKVKPNLILNKRLSKNTIFTKIDSIYIKSVKTKKEKLQIIYSFLRFFENGQFMDGPTKNNSNRLKDYNNLKRANVGYYQIKNNQIILEQFMVTPHDCGSYHKGELKVIGDSIVGYKKIKVEGLTGTPDW
ncbi:hypothetical protein CXF68_03735 [Tenacibaculum sp. Bg11-29]|uniref:hypothetical protein n=1 Tax=Tenacibaculum sp. Bg11-29 TaxID=2058306 RepID=UPI000C340238|nr:hypothetical protein [Tenacibaculum sp. Bg11-29]PKH49863.1 hypothetical protein CXF68_03735 [Tenacibaculum sp. Bg11-29]